MTGEVAAKIVADTSGFQAGMAQAATAAEREQKRIAQFVKLATDEMKRQAGAAKEAANTAPYEKVATAAKKAAESHAGAQREVLVLAHELSQGNYSRFGGSLLVLGEQINLMGKLATPAGAALGLLAGVVGGATVAMAMGAIEADKFAKQLQLTGNFAAITAGQIEALTSLQKSQTGQTSGGARETLEAVAGSGRFGPQALAQVARAMGDYQKLTHESAEDAAKVFDSLADDASAWAEKMNKSYHFLSLAQFEQIKAMQDAGDKQGAAALASDALAQALESRGTPAVGAFARAWHAVSESVTGAIDAIKRVGRPEDSLTASIAAIDRQIALVKQANTANPGDAADYLNRLASERSRLAGDQFRQGERIAAQSVAAQEAQAGIEAAKYTEQVLKSAKAVSARNEELTKFRNAVAAQAAAGKPVDPRDVKAGEDSINKRYENHSAASQANEYANLMETIKAFNQTTAEETDRMGALTAGQKFSIQAHEELAKAGKKLSQQQRETVASAIDEAAAHRTVADMLLAAQKATIARVQADTANQQEQQRNVESVIQAGNDQANAILRQTSLIGKSADDILKIQELQKFDDLVGKALLGADADGVKRIIEVSGVIRGNLVSAIDAAKQAQDDFNASFVNGWNKAAQDFQKQAANSAAFGEKVFADAANGMTDAIVNFAMTGKLSFKSMIDSIIQDLIRMEAQKAVSWLAGGGTSGGGSGFGAAASAAGGVDWGNLGKYFGVSFANGLDYVPYDGFPAVLHEGEKVVRRQDATAQRGGGVAIHIDQSGASYGAGVDAAGVAQIARAQADRAKAEIQRSLATNGRFS